MPVFNYKALKENGSGEAGVIDADSPKEARLKLRGRKLHVTDLESIEEKEARQKGIRAPIFRRKRKEEIGIITRQMATLSNSGIPIMGTLSAIIEQTESKDLRATMMDIREKVATGSTLSDSMGGHSIYFNDLYVSMVRAGEAAGNLDMVLFRLADFLQASTRMKAKIVAAMIYPIVMLVIGGGVITFLMTFIVPQILDVISQQGKMDALPLPTVILVAVSGFFESYWWAIISVFIGSLVSWMAYINSPRGRLWWDTNKLKIPLFGNLMRKAAVARFALTFATLLESGIPVLDALNVVKTVVSNQFLANTLDVVRMKIAEGADIATPLKTSKVFPPVVGYMIAVGEEGGRLEELLKRIAEAYDEEVELSAQKMTSLLEPIMILTMAVLVGFIILSVLLPILEMSNI